MAFAFSNFSEAFVILVSVVGLDFVISCLVIYWLYIKICQ